MATNPQDPSVKRPRRDCAKKSDIAGILRKKEKKEKEKEIKSILSKPAKLRSKDEKKMLRECKDVAKEMERRERLRTMVKMKTEEIEDSSDVLDAKIDELVSALRQAKHVVIYTGAGISTAASIPDYRGPNGVWTLLQKGQVVRTTSLVDAEPTLTHMAIRELHQQGVIQHVVSQNCDGLHLRSGLPQRALSEVHGNMFVEVCTECDPEIQYIRLFDVTERTSLRRHWTGRSCHSCGGPLRDSIVHFGEKGAVEQPLNWPGAVSAAGDADMILCLGSTLKVLKRYACLWGTGKPRNKQPRLFIVNLQWTPKDKMASLKIHGRCDDVMQQVMSRLDLKIPQYDRSQDPIIPMATPLKKPELHSFSTKLLEAVPIAGSVKNKSVSTSSDQLVKRDTSGLQQQQPSSMKTELNQVEPVPASSDQNVNTTQSNTNSPRIESDRMKPVPAGCGATDKADNGSQVSHEVSSKYEGDLGLETEMDYSTQNKDTNQNPMLIKPGWFGKGYHKKISRGRKRRKISQDSI
ncbi:NAD-dependent protein deacetylase sirtuin-7-like [Asterias amurensis]|uniref:NAD-dependent protein deacetylase sirtuin-7-like n=1 Tax=Asterias amurensis TaxID=7602 RepID=UPI003AB7BB1F